MDGWMDGWMDDIYGEHRGRQCQCRPSTSAGIYAVLRSLLPLDKSDSILVTSFAYARHDRLRARTHARMRARAPTPTRVCVCARACVCVQIPFDTRRSGAHGSTVWVRDRNSRATLPGIPMLQHGCTVLNGIVLCCARLYCAMLQSTSPFPVRQHTAPNSTYASASVPCKSQRTVWTALGLEHRPRRSGLTPTYSQPSMRLLHRSPVGTVTCA